MSDIVIPRSGVKGFLLGVVCVVALFGAIGLSIAVISAQNSRLTDLATPTANSDAATKAYVDAGSYRPANWTCTIRSNSTTGSGLASTTIYCNANERLIVGACDDSDCQSSSIALGSILYNSHPIGTNGWYCATNTGATRTLYARAQCCT